MLLLTYRPLGPPTLLLGYQRRDATQAPEAPTQAPETPTQARAPVETRAPVTLDLEPRAPISSPTPHTPSHDLFGEKPPPQGRPRTQPEVQVDPRTVFKQRGRPTRLEPRAATPTLPLADQAVTDLMIVPQLPSFRASEQGIKAVINYLRATQILTAKQQKSFPDGSVAIELLPDVFVHLAFTDEGGAPPGAPCIAEASLWFGPKQAPLPFGPTRESCFRLELVGVRYPRVSDAFVARLNSILYLRAEVHPVPHDPRRLRKPAAVVAAEPIPLFDVQER